MRITKLEFENLNSLKGKWTIDFSHPDYAKNHDIFVIHGPTGSGKTTILDAITLALYGRTPRLNSINGGKTGNEIMTRGTGFCRASVSYSCKKGDFVSEFQQNRANGKAAGNLQKASFKISKIDTDNSDLGTLFSDSAQVVASGTGSLLAEETQKIIQLDYNQFCRSIMLAQGEFSAFLESEVRERAEILEKLTGTERYRKIGQNIAEKFKEIKKEFQLAKEQKQEIETLILSSEAEEHAKNQEQQLTERLNETEKNLSELQKKLTFFSELKRLQTELEEAKTENQKIEIQKNAFSEHETRLLQAKCARNCETEFTTLKNHRGAQQNDKEQLTKLEFSLNQIEKIFSENQKLSLEAKTEFEIEETDLKEQQKLWKKVREIDIQCRAAQEKFSDCHNRKSKTEQEISELTEKILVLTENLSQIEKNIFEQTKYLEQNKNDEKILEVIAKIDTFKGTLLQNQHEKSEIQNELSTYALQKENFSAKLNDLESEFAKIEEEIHHFISEDSIFISKLLSLQLSDGNPCPVCGSIYHKNHSEEEKFDIDTKKAGEITENSANLNEKRENFQNQIQEVSKKLEVTKSGEENALKNLAAKNAQIDETVSKIKETLSDWETINAIEELDSILNKLHIRSQKWLQTHDFLDKNKNEKSAKEAELHALSQNLESQKQNFEVLKDEFALSENNFTSFKNERLSLFGEKSVDDKENAKNQKIALLKEKSKNAEEALHNAKDEKSRLDAQKSQTEKAISERKTEIAKAEQDFIQKITENGFTDEEDFIHARLETTEFEILTKQSEFLKTKLTEAQTRLKNAQKSYEDFKNQANIEENQAEVLQNFENAQREQKELSAKIVEIRVQLKNNEQNRSKAKKINSDYERLSEEFSTWEQMKSWIGKDDGSDVSVFVQSLAFNSLLNLANKNLFGITNRYKLVQKNAGSLDFEIQDIYFEENRSASNLSGGEKFLVSLSFALGISEFASKNVRVDSLFLDEGFGTLSGELLTEAINALKNLQKDGKMLGIITHVQDVINEIDQKIEVKQISNGHSILLGSGISEADARA